MKAAVMGASGRMGRMLIGAIEEHDRSEIGGAVERPGHDWIGRDLGTCLGGAETGITVVDDVSQVIREIDAILDFTSPSSSAATAAVAAEAGVAHVIGTTGFDAEDIAAIDAAAARTVIVRAGNMSLGVNLLTRLVRDVAAALDDGFDIEIVESHHRHKVDAPSGTALMLGEAAAEGRGVRLDDVAERGRDGITGARETGAIGFSAIRGGDIVGSHDVIFAGAGEIVTLRHVATDRRLFARGAVQAALWAQGRAPGHYDMLNVLGLD